MSPLAFRPIFHTSSKHQTAWMHATQRPTRRWPLQWRTTKAYSLPKKNPQGSVISHHTAVTNGLQLIPVVDARPSWLLITGKWLTTVCFSTRPSHLTCFWSVADWFSRRQTFEWLQNCYILNSSLRLLNGPNGTNLHQISQGADPDA